MSKGTPFTLSGQLAFQVHPRSSGGEGMGQEGGE